MALIWIEIKYTETDLNGKMSQEIAQNFIPVLRVITTKQSIIELPMTFYSKYLLLERFDFTCFSNPYTGLPYFNGDDGWIKTKHNQCHWAHYYWPKPKRSLFYLFIFSLELFTYNKFCVVLETCLFCVKCSCPENHKRKINGWWLMACGCATYTRYTHTCKWLFI